MVKALCNNTEEGRLINKCGHGISYSLFKKIETEFALKVSNEQIRNSVPISDECNQPKSPPLTLMAVEYTLSRAVPCTGGF